MKIDIQGLRNKPEISFDFEDTLFLNDLGLASDKEGCTVHVKGSIIKRGSIYVLKGELDTELSFLCDRCLEGFNYPIRSELYREFSPDIEDQDDEEDTMKVVNSVIDLTDVIAEAIYLELPMKRLCRSDCKGICVVCGQDLNEKTCGCSGYNIDPRLEGLKNIFS